VKALWRKDEIDAYQQAAEDMLRFNAIKNFNKHKNDFDPESVLDSTNSVKDETDNTIDINPKSNLDNKSLSRVSNLLINAGARNKSSRWEVPAMGAPASSPVV